MINNNYLVTICGYEDMESVFGPFGKQEAYNFFCDLKKVFDENNLHDEYEYDSSREVPKAYGCSLCENLCYLDIKIYQMAKKYNIWSPPHTTNQICIMKGGGKNNPIKCACEEFPDRPKMKEGSWLF